MSEHYFPPGRSVLRRVHGERAVGLLYGQRALLIGACDPLTYTGTMLSTRAGDMPFRRLVHTGKLQETIMLGTRAEADAALATVRRMHERVAGELPEDAGPVPAGTPYSAFDPELMLWTLAVIADSGRVLYETLVRPLSEREREDLWQDYLLFGELFGLPRSGAPASHREFAEYWEERVRSATFHATADALEMGPRVAFHQPVPLYAQAGIELNTLIIKGTLPVRVRQIYGIRWTPAHGAAWRLAVESVRRSRPLVPHSLRRGRNDRHFDLVAQTERQRVLKARAAG